MNCTKDDLEHAARLIRRLAGLAQVAAAELGLLATRLEHAENAPDVTRSRSPQMVTWGDVPGAQPHERDRDAGATGPARQRPTLSPTPLVPPGPR
jgi:hypothetical protein